MTAVRPFAPADLERVMEIWLAANLQAHGFVPAEYWTGNAPQVRRQLPQAELYVYETGGVVQGFAGLQGDYLAGIFVDGAARGLGIGRQLLDRCKAQHPALTLRVYRQNSRAAAFYRREGFAVIAGGTDPATGQPELTMAWRRG